MTTNATTHQVARARAAVETIKAIVCGFYGLTETDLTGKRRIEPLATRRQIAMALAYNETESSSPDVARAFNREDHNTVLWAVRAIEAKGREDAGVFNDFVTLRAKVRETLS